MKEAIESITCDFYSITCARETSWKVTQGTDETNKSTSPACFVFPKMAQLVVNKYHSGTICKGVRRAHAPEALFLCEQEETTDVF